MPLSSTPLPNMSTECTGLRMPSNRTPWMLKRKCKCATLQRTPNHPLMSCQRLLEQEMKINWVGLLFECKCLHWIPMALMLTLQQRWRAGAANGEQGYAYPLVYLFCCQQPLGQLPQGNLLFSCEANITEKECTKRKRKFVRDNPHLIDSFFYTHVQDAMKRLFGKDCLEAKWIWFQIEYQEWGTAQVHVCCHLRIWPQHDVWHVPGLV